MKKFFAHKWLTAITVALLVALVVFTLAVADNVQNDVVAGGNGTIIEGDSTTINYRITANNGDGQTGCNAADNTPAYVTINVPGGVTVSPASLTFYNCGVELPATFSSNTAGNYEITVSVSDGGVGTYNLNPAKFTLQVNTAPPPTDSTPPVITPSVSGTLGNNGWYVSDVFVTWSVVDAESSIASTSGCDPTTIANDTAGTTLTCTATSAGGTASESVSIKRDATPPTIAFLSQTPARNSFGWNNSDVIIAWTCADATSNVVGLGTAVTVTSEGADLSATGTCEDLAGNTASDTQTGINIDKTAPTASATASPAPNAYGWNNTNVTVSFGGSDSLSGIDTCSPDVVLSAEGAGQSASGTCTDKAGNVSSTAAISGINIDKTAPTLAPSVSPNPVVLNAAASASPNAADVLSGLASASCDAVDTSHVGTYTVTCIATDKAGNTASSSISYTVQYGLCLLYDPAKTHKSGSTVPLKLQLCDANGVNVSASDIVVTAVSVSKLDNSAPGLPEDSGNANPDYNFRYDSTLGGTGGYIYNYSTKGKTTGTWKVTFKVDGGGAIYFVTFDIK